MWWSPPDENQQDAVARLTRDGFTPSAVTCFDPFRLLSIVTPEHVVSRGRTADVSVCFGAGFVCLVPPSRFEKSCAN